MSLFQSMTAYSVKEFQHENKQYHLHIKSVNHKNFDLKWRTPRSWTAFEIDSRKALQKRFSRGSFEFWIEESKDKSANKEALLCYFQKLNEHIDQLKGLSLLRFPWPLRTYLVHERKDLWINNDEQKNDFLPKELFQNYLLELMQDFESERNKEGNALKKTIKANVDDIEKKFLAVSKVVPLNEKKRIERYKKKMSELFSEESIDQKWESRMQSEVTFILEKKDVTEELDRIQIHINKAKDWIEAPPENIGRRLDFLCQELNREWNTLANKCQEVEISNQSQEVKLLLEKIREQAANLV